MTDLELQILVGFISGIVGALAVIGGFVLLRAYMEHRWSRRQHNTDFLSEWK